jgi:hypothetical protein
MRGFCVAVVATSLVGFTSEPAAAQEKRAKPLPAEILAAWKKAGAQVGWMSRHLIRMDNPVEEDVADNSARLLGDKRHPEVAAVPQGVHEPGLFALTEGESVDVPDGFLVGDGFGMDHEAHGFDFHIGNDMADHTGELDYTG